MERDSLLEGTCPSVMVLKFYMCCECLQIHLDMLDGEYDVEPMVTEVIGNQKMSLAAKNIFLMLNVDQKW